MDLEDATVRVRAPLLKVHVEHTSPTRSPSHNYYYAPLSEGANPNSGVSIEPRRVQNLFLGGAV